MNKYFFGFFFMGFFFMFGCKSQQKVTKKSDFNIEPNHLATRNDTTDYLNGVKRIKNFQLYSRKSGEGAYRGEPKIEFFGGTNKVKASVPSLDAVSLFGDLEVELKYLDGYGENTYLLKYDTKNQGFFVNSKYFSNPDFAPAVLFDLSYEVQNDVVIAKYTYFALEPNGNDLFGAMSEAIVWDSIGKEIGRFTMEGQIAEIGISKDLNFLYASTGGMINEDARHPTAFWAYDLTKAQLVFTRKEKNGECIHGGVIEGTNRGVMTIGASCANRRGKHSVFIFDHLRNVIYFSTLAKECWQDQSYLAETWGDRCDCYSDDGKKFTFFYEKDFQSEVYLKK